jgi:3-oxoacyl-[acyl-carrier-protein] synthase III
MLIEYFLPDQIVTNEDLKADFPDWDCDAFENKIGIKQRHIADKNTTALDLAVSASEKVLQHFDKKKIDFVLFCTQSPDYFIPTSACLLQNRLGLKTNCGALDFNLGCSGYVYGLSLAKGLLVAGIAQNILFVVSETYSKHIYPKDRTNRSIFGDGAAATILDISDISRIGHFELHTDGKGYDKLIVKNGGFRFPYDSNASEKSYGTDNFFTDNHLFMDGPEIFNFTIETIPDLIEGTLIKNNYKKEEIDFYIFHQANAFMLNFLRKKIRIPVEKFYINMEKTGNTVSATIPIAIKESLLRGMIKTGDKVLIAGFGVGLSWGATIIEIK